MAKGINDLEGTKDPEVAKDLKKRTLEQNARTAKIPGSAPFGGIFWFATTLLFAGIGIALMLLPEATPPSSFKDTASILTFITAAALAIERITEALWTFIGGQFGSFWPLNYVRNSLEVLKSQLDDGVEPMYNKYADIKKEMKNVYGSYKELLNLAKDNQRVRLLTARVRNELPLMRKVNAIQIGEQRDVRKHLDALDNFVEEFKDNPGRRLLSLYFGVLLGIVVAGFFGLDIFYAVLETAPNHPRTQIILTGIIIGLGASPTHEIIKALQEYKTSRKANNTNDN